MIATYKDEYLRMKRSHRGRVVVSLLENELCDIKFVIPVAKALEGLLGKSVNTKGARLLGEPRRKSILSLHGSVEDIQSYPENVCIEVGLAWAKDIVSHLLREDNKESSPKKRKQPNSSSHQPTKKKRQSIVGHDFPTNSAESKRQRYALEEANVLDSPISSKISVESIESEHPSTQQSQKYDDFAPIPVAHITKHTSADSSELSRFLHSALDSLPEMNVFSSVDLVSKMLLDHQDVPVTVDEKSNYEEAIFEALAENDFDLLHANMI